MFLLVSLFSFFIQHRAATSVLIGSPPATFAGRRFMRLAGLFLRAADLGFLSPSLCLAGASSLLALGGAPCSHTAARAETRSLRRVALRGLAVARDLAWAFFSVSPSAAIITTEKTAPHSNSRANPALNLVRFALWTLRDKAAQRRLALR